MSKIFKPRRGTENTMKTVKSNTVLAAGELFAELPNTGAGTGKGRLVMGDGVTAYGSLPSFVENTDVSTAAVTITADSSATSTAALNNVSTGATAGALIGSLKQAISLTKSELTNTIDDHLNAITDAGSKGFYFDYQNGEYGFNTSELRGADTFSPFSSGLPSLTFTSSGNFKTTCRKPGGGWNSSSAWQIYTDCLVDAVLMQAQLPTNYQTIRVNLATNCTATLVDGLLIIRSDATGRGTAGDSRSQNAVYTATYTYNISVFPY